MPRASIACLLALAALPALPACTTPPAPRTPAVVVLGIAQDGGVPQAGSFDDARWDEPRRQRQVVCLGIVDPARGKRWMIDATPDFPRQLLELYRTAPGPKRPVLDGIFLTHAHMGHYPGLLYLGKESTGAKEIPVWAMPRMRAFLEGNAPWNFLVSERNIVLHELAAETPVDLGGGIRVTPIVVPHRQEFSETVAFRIDGPDRAYLWMPDIDSWRELDAMGTRIEDLVASVDIAYIDGTFFANGEIPGRDMSGFPHPFIRDTLARFAALPERERRKVRFIHLNHTNPALQQGSAAWLEIDATRMEVAQEGEIRFLELP